MRSTKEELEIAGDILKRLSDMEKPKCNKQCKWYYSCDFRKGYCKVVVEKLLGIHNGKFKFTVVDVTRNNKRVGNFPEIAERICKLCGDNNPGGCAKRALIRKGEETYEKCSSLSRNTEAIIDMFSDIDMPILDEGVTITTPDDVVTWLDKIAHDLPINEGEVIHAVSNRLSKALIRKYR